MIRIKRQRFAEIHIEHALRLARAFTALGLHKGDVAAIQLPNVPEFVITYFATSLMGAVLCPMLPDPHGADRLFSRLDRRSSARYVPGPAVGGRGGGRRRA